MAGRAGLGISGAVRINGVDTPWFERDLALLSASQRVSSIMLPKADGHSPWSAFGDKPVLALVETATGIEALRTVAGANGVHRIAFGSIDLQLDLGIEGDDDALLLFRSELVLASRLANLPPPVDGVCTALNDVQALTYHVQRARRLGFGSMLCVHPSQVDAVNAGFRPGAKQLNWARRVLEAASASNGAAVAVDGKMVDRPVLARARAILDDAT